jgi:starch-binding outer membrane protein, SusD/RagB family
MYNTNDMKNILIICLLLACLAACKKSDSFLDNKSTAGLTEANTFSDSARTMQFLGRIYSDMGFSFNKGRWSSHGNTEQATDDAEYAYSGTGQGAVVLYNGTVSPINTAGGLLADFWNVPYTNIRRANLLMVKLPVTPLSATMQSRVKGEAKFLRAWFYGQLLIAYGGFPVVEDNVYGIEDIINLPRSTYADCVTYISKELDEAGALLPESVYPADADYGRVTKGACMGLKSRILLYAASPLFNGGANTTDANIAKLVSYPAYDVKYWQAAADAAQAVINTSYYKLYEDPTVPVPGYGFYRTFLVRINPEFILGVYRPGNKDFEVFYNPPSRGGQKNSMPTQNLVDAFLMKNGKTINEAGSGYNAADPYVNREPRFRYSIIFNTSSYANSSNAQAQVFTYNTASQDGYPATTTGYYSRKMCDSTVANNGSAAGPARTWPLIRYAEMLLNHAEAINETGQTALAYPKIIELRKRAGIEPGADNLYGLKANMTKEEMRAVVQNERRIELAFEDQRWHDIRRWKTAMAVGNAFNNTMVITKVGNNYTYQVTPSSRRHNFRPEMYLLPIPNDEVRKMPKMVQNPGW